MSLPADQSKVMPLEYTTLKRPVAGVDASIDRMIDAGVNPKRMRAHFGNTYEAAKYIGQYLAARHSLERVGTGCELCAKVNAEVIVATDWRLRMARRSLEFSLSALTPRVFFRTFHRLCAGCFERWETQRARRATLRVVVAVLLFVLAIVVWAVWQRYATDSDVLPTTITWTALLPSLALIALMPLAGVIKWLFRRPYPRALHFPPGLDCVQLAHVEMDRRAVKVV